MAREGGEGRCLREEYMGEMGGGWVRGEGGAWENDIWERWVVVG